MKNQDNKTNTKRTYQAPQVTEVRIDSEISLVMMSYPGDPGTLPTQDPLMSIKAFKIFK